jgi:hypothetical protein
VFRIERFEVCNSVLRKSSSSSSSSSYSKGVTSWNILASDDEVEYEYEPEVDLNIAELLNLISATRNLEPSTLNAEPLNLWTLNPERWTLNLWTLNS